MTKTLRSIKGRRTRITRLDECGVPVFGDCSTVVTSGFIRVTFSREEETGDEYLQKNAWGEFCINEKDPDLTKWWNTTIEFCEVDPDILDITGGATPVSFNEEVIGATFGESPPVGQFALEVWTKKAGHDNCTEGVQEWGYFVTPRVRNGKVDGDINIENAALTMSIVGEAIGATQDWGVGPYGDNPMKTTTGFPAGDQLGIVVTDVQPPDLTDGCQPLAEPPDQSEVGPGDVFPEDPNVTAQDQTNADDLTSNGYIVSPDADSAWATGEFFSIGDYEFFWDGTAWQPGQAP